MNIRSKLGISLFIFVVLFAIAVRLPTFFLPHDNGDQVFYLGLAMKLDLYGFAGYTLRNVDVGGKITDDGLKYIIEVYPTEDRKGGLLKGMEMTGLTYYDEPLFHRPYGFPLALMVSHRLFSRTSDYAALCTSGRDRNGYVYSVNSGKTWPKQFYAAFIPFIFSMLFIVCTYFLARLMFNENVALLASFILSITPIEIFCSQKTWADTMLSFFVVLSVLLYYLAKERKNLLFALLAGMSIGAAFLAKQTGGIIIIVLFICHLWEKRADIRKFRNLPGIIFDKTLIAVLLGFVLIASHWFYLAIKTYGNPLYKPPRSSGIFEKVGWFMMLSRRPRFLYLATIPAMLPLFALGYYAVIAGLFIKDYASRRRYILIFWFVTFLSILIYMNTKENRYMLPAYPAIAILSADVMQRIGLFLNNKFGRRLGTLFVLAVLICSAIYSVPIGIRHAMANVALIIKPF